jgi:alkanesulfonate monooxygenase SsuD/methylene tetrahydromethanopterin reductase-like flavin-dependent oxidoreductase (luciferase family)
MTVFRAYAFTEMPYPYNRQDFTDFGPDGTPAPRGYREPSKFAVPNRVYDPDTGLDLYRKYLDIYEAADELGLDIMCNEHHASAACTNSAVPLILAILSRTTKRARLLALGNPVANRSDPIRVAEEMAIIDVVSGGRLEAGLVKGSPEEIANTNTNPVFHRERYWEAVDLITKAWTSHDGPFNWEGRHFQHRQVNIWPRPYQTPHPPVWITTLSAGNAREIAIRDYIVAIIMNGPRECRKIFDVYREAYTEAHGRPAPLDKLSYTAFVYVGDTDAEARREASKLRWHLANTVLPHQFRDVPGFIDAQVRAKMAEAGQRATAEGGGFLPATVEVGRAAATAPIESLAGGGVVFAGNPETVFGELRDFFYAVGGFGHLVMEVQGGTMGYGSVVRSMELFAAEVLPRLRAEVADCAAGQRDELGRVVVG